MKNLTEVSLKNKVIVWYFIIMSVVMGIFSYISLGRMEDPTFTTADGNHCRMAGGYRPADGGTGHRQAGIESP